MGIGPRSPILSLTSIGNHLLRLTLGFRQPHGQHFAFALQVNLVRYPVVHGFFVLCHQLGAVGFSIPPCNISINHGDFVLDGSNLRLYFPQADLKLIACLRFSIVCITQLHFVLGYLPIELFELCLVLSAFGIKFLKALHFFVIHKSGV
ncbi:hypothetical protein D3C76_967640 [compost metagenome]